MRFMMIVPSSAESEAGAALNAENLGEIRAYTEILAKAGILLAAERLHASSRGARVRLAHKKITVTAGPFPVTRELIAGFWVIRANSKDEAIEWAKRAPKADGEIELRQVFEVADFPADPSEKPDGWREHEQRFRDAIDITSPDANPPPRKAGTLRYMIIHKGGSLNEAGILPDAASLAEMGTIIDEQIAAGNLLAADGLQASAKGARVRPVGGKRIVIDGPFAETKELVGGYSIVQLRSREEAIAFAKRCVVVCPPGMNEGEIEVRELMDLALK